MTTPGDEYPGAGLWSVTGTGPPSPRPSASQQNIVSQLPVGQVFARNPVQTAARGAPPKTPTGTPTSTWTCLCRCRTCCVCCGYDCCARCCWPCTCCRCCYWLFMIIILVVLALGLVVLALWKILHPKLPTYNVDTANFSYSVTNATSGNATSVILNARTVFIMETTNPNKRIGIYYDQINLNVKLFSLVIGNQIIPKFYNGYNVTSYINGNMTSGPLTLNSTNQVALAAALNSGNLPLNLSVGVKVRIGIGHWASPQLKVQLLCALTIDPGVTSGSQITSMKCGFSFKL